MQVHSPKSHPETRAWRGALMRPRDVAWTWLFSALPRGLVAALVATNALAAGADIAAENRLPILPLSEQEYVTLALAENDSIRQRQMDRLISEQGRITAEAIFEPALQMDIARSYGFEENTTESAVQRFYETEYEYRDLDYSVGVKGMLPTGGDYRLYYQMEDLANSLQSDAVYGNENVAEAALEVTQPLFKNAGLKVNRAGIDIAYQEQGITADRLQKTRMTVAYQAHLAYATMQFALARLKLDEQMLEHERGRGEQIAKLFDEGRVSAAQVDLSRSVLRRRAAQVSAARRQLRRTASEARRLLIGAEQRQLTGVLPSETQLALIPMVSPNFSRLEQLINDRPEFKEAKKVLTQEDLRLEVARNQTLPDINLRFILGKTGLGDDVRSAHNKLDGPHEFWEVGLQVNVPLGGKSAKSQLAAARIKKQQALDTLRSLALLIHDEILVAHEELQQTTSEAKEYQQSVTALERVTRENQTRVEQGQMNQLDLISGQLDLLDARKMLVEKIYEQRRAALTLALAEGGILEWFDRYAASASSQASAR
ncbi:type I secretion outer membrane protein, TolC family [Thiorhodovibrio winogradskyi]|uniref:Type I secretion outer membrane protein, TolC family n=1 Tax=Thiorhodovibrio winogradskyi TaxID=77007 RepID=A0ABZ0SGY2_9GAMM|nr:TolC family protein [Thiorhodovibrio winogradskyi]